MTDPADALLELAWTERRLAAEGRVDELQDAHAERDRLLAALPAGLAPPQVAVLRRALAVQGEVAELLAATRDAVATELGRIDHGRTTLRGYAPAQDGPARTLDLSG